MNEGCEYTHAGKYAVQCADFPTSLPSMMIAQTGKCHLGCYANKSWRAFFKYPLIVPCHWTKRGNADGWEDGSVWGLGKKKTLRAIYSYDEEPAFAASNDSTMTLLIRDIAALRYSARRRGQCRPQMCHSISLQDQLPTRAG